MRYIWIIIVFCGFASLTFSQKIPKNPNKTDGSGKRQGTWTILFDASFHEVTTVDQAEYYRIITYKDDVPVGRVNDYFLDGNKQWEGEFIQDRPTEIAQGKIIFYYRNGKIENIYNYVNGKLNGQHLNYDSLGNKSLEANYLNDSLHGTATIYYPNGIISGIHTYKYGNRDGQSRTYYQNGKKKTDLNYKNGRRHGKWIWYDENGQESDRAEYDNGRQVGSISQEISTRYPVEMNIQSEPARNIQAIEFHPDGKFYAVSAEDYSLQIRESTNDLIIRILTGHTAELISFQLIDDGKKLISADRDGILLMFDTQTGKIEKRLNTHLKDIIGFSFIELEDNTESMTYIFSRSKGAVTYTDWSKSYEKDPIGLDFATYLASDVTNSYYAAVMAANEDYGIVKAGECFAMMVSLNADTVKGRALTEIYPKTSIVKLSPVNQIIAFAGKQHIEVWDFNTKKKLLFWEPLENEFKDFYAIEDIDFSDDGKYLTFSIEEKIVIIDIPKNEVYTRLIKFGAPTKAVAFQPGTKRFLLSAGTSLFSYTIEDEGWYSVDQISIEHPEFVCFTQSGKEMLQFSRYGITQWDMSRAKSAFWLYPGVDYSKEWLPIAAGAVSAKGDFVVLSNGKDKIVTCDVQPLRVGTISADGFIGKAIGVNPKTDEIILLGKHPGATEKNTDIYARIYGYSDKKLKKEKLLFSIPDRMILHDVSNVAFTDDGEYFTCTSGDGILTKIRYKDLTVVSSDTISARVTIYKNQSISPNGKWLVYQTTQGNGVWIVKDILSGKETKIIDEVENAVVSWLPDASQLLMATPDGRLYAFNTKTWVKPEALKTVVFPSGIVAVDNRYFAVYSEYSGRIEFRDMSISKPILTFLQFGKGDRVRVSAFYTPDNYYSGASSALKNMHFTMGLSTFGIDQFDLQFNRPDVIIDRLPLGDPNLKSSYKRIWQKRIRKLGFSEETFGLKAFEAPLIAIENSNRLLTSDKDTFKIFAEYNDDKYLLDRVHVRVNNVPIYGTAGYSLTTFAVAEWANNFYVPLSPGKNKIEISVVNELGIESPARSVTVTRNVLLKPTLHVFAIGVSKYRDSRMNLTYASKDAQDIVNLFGKNLSQRYDSVKVHLINDDKATRSTILDLRKQLENTHIEDQVIFFYAGHGVLDDSLDYFLATYDIDFRNPKAKGLKYDDIEKLLDNIPARQKLLLIDACHSGEIDKEDVTLSANQNAEIGKVKFRSTPGVQVTQIGLENSIELMQELFSDLRKGNGSTVISSAGGAEYAMESKEWNNGVFTYSLIRGLQDQSSDLNKDKEITIEELQKYLQQRVSELTQGKQKPTSRIINLENNFRIW